MWFTVALDIVYIQPKAYIWSLWFSPSPPKQKVCCHCYTLSQCLFWDQIYNPRHSITLFHKSVRLLAFSFPKKAAVWYLHGKPYRVLNLLPDPWSLLGQCYVANWDVHPIFFVNSSNSFLSHSWLSSQLVKHFRLCFYWGQNTVSLCVYVSIASEVWLRDMQTYLC